MSEQYTNINTTTPEKIWRRIKTAPKDGTRIIGTSEGCGEFCYYWCEKEQRWSGACQPWWTEYEDKPSAEVPTHWRPTDEADAQFWKPGLRPAELKFIGLEVNVFCACGKTRIIPLDDLDDSKQIQITEEPCECGRYLVNISGPPTNSKLDDMM